MAALTSETGEGLRHVGRLLRRWWLLLVGGTLLALTIASIGLVGSTTRYAADALILVNQPGLARLEEGKTVVEKVASLLPTYAQLAVSDAVLADVRQRAAIPGSIRDLRSDVVASPVTDTLTIRLRVERDTSDAALEATAALVAALAERIRELDDEAAQLLVERAEDPGAIGTLTEAARTTVTELQEPTVTELGQNVPQTLALAFVLGLGFSMVAAFVLDRS